MPNVTKDAVFYHSGTAENEKGNARRNTTKVRSREIRDDCFSQANDWRVNYPLQPPQDKLVPTLRDSEGLVGSGALAKQGEAWNRHKKFKR